MNHVVTYEWYGIFNVLLVITVYLHQKDFLPLPNPQFPYCDIREEQLEKNSGLCMGPPVLGGEVQPTYPRPTMPFGGEHPGVECSDGALPLLP